jgi:hypothetical protein
MCCGIPVASRLHEGLLQRGHARWHRIKVQGIAKRCRHRTVATSLRFVVLWISGAATDGGCMTSSSSSTVRLEQQHSQTPMLATAEP